MVSKGCRMHTNFGMNITGNVRLKEKESVDIITGAKSLCSEA
jgi:hypothetical protein